ETEIGVTAYNPKRSCSRSTVSGTTEIRRASVRQATDTRANPLTRTLPSTVTKPVTSQEISKALILTTQYSFFGKYPFWKIAQNKPGSAIREGGPRRRVSHAWRAATQQLLKNADQPVLRDKPIISPRNVPDGETTPPGF